MGGVKIIRAVLLGAGNVATHLGLGLFKAGVDIVQVYNRSAGPAIELSGYLSSLATKSIAQIVPDADLYLICVKDDAIASLAERLSYHLQTERSKDLPPPIVAHTAGSCPIDVLTPYFENAAVWYPLQTFNKEIEVEMSKVPFLIEAQQEQTAQWLESVALDISSTVFQLSSSDRLRIHMAAVYCCNFVNAMYRLAQEEMQKADLPFDLLLPLIQETAYKVRYNLPSEVQTGPALRWDETTMNKHLDLLSDDPIKRDIYRMMSQYIYQQHNRYEQD